MSNLINEVLLMMSSPFNLYKIYIMKALGRTWKAGREGKRKTEKQGEILNGTLVPLRG